MTRSTTTSVDASLAAGDTGAVVIPGLAMHRLVAHVDARGFLTEFFRSSWGIAAISQWTAMTLSERAVRGPSVHVRHLDALIVLSGEMQIGFRDLREGSPVFCRPYRLTLSGCEPTLVLVPPGVMHTFYAATGPVLVVVGSTHEYLPEDDIRCRLQDAGMDIDASTIGAEDGRAQSLDEVIAALRTRL